MIIINYNDIPGFVGQYSDQLSSNGIKGEKSIFIICCLDALRIIPESMILNSIEFIDKYLPNILVTKDNLNYSSKNSRFRRSDHFDLVFVGNDIRKWIFFGAE